MHQRDLHSPLQALAVKWHMIGLDALAFARLLRRYEDAYKPGAAECAGQLELAARTAQAMILQDIGNTAAMPPPPENRGR